MGLESIAIAKRTVSIRRNKNPAYKKPFLPQRWDKMFKAKIEFRPRPVFLFNKQKPSKSKYRPIMASINIDKEASVMRRKGRKPRVKRGPKKQVYLI